jgi:hypothetical protein
LEASKSGMLNEAAYTHAKRFYVFLFEEQALSELEQPQETTTGAANRPPADAPSPPELAGKRVREFFGVAEEAFVLSVLRSHLDHRMLQQQQQQQQQQQKEDKMAPSHQDDPSSLGGAENASRPSVGALLFSSILTTAVEVSQMLATQEATFGFDSPFIHFNNKEIENYNGYGGEHG